MPYWSVFSRIVCTAICRVYQSAHDPKYTWHAQTAIINTNAPAMTCSRHSPYLKKTPLPSGNGAYDCRLGQCTFTCPVA